MRLTRREALAGAAAVALGSAGIYELVDRLGGSSPKRPSVSALPPEQHVLDGLAVVEGIQPKNQISKQASTRIYLRESG